MRFLFLMIASAIAFKPNLCINCKFFKKDNFSQPKYGKCTLFPIIIEDDNYEVTGIVASNKIEYQFCSIIRRHGECGQEGRLFVPNE